MRYVTSAERFGIEKGLERGLEQGLEKGLLKGEAKMVRRLLQRRFGPLPAWVEERLQTADEAQLDRWAERLLDAPSQKKLS